MLLVKDVTRDMWGWGFLERAWRDVQDGARMLRPRPGFAVVAVLSLAMGIGASSTIFSFVKAIILRDLPYDRPEELVDIHLELPGMSLWTMSYPNFEDVRDGTGAVFTGLALSCQLIGLLGAPRASPFDVGFATSGATDGTDYPTVAEFRRHWKEIEADLQAALEGASEAAVRAVLDGGPHAGRSVLDAVAFFTFHEAYHVGALGAIRKAMGLPGPAERVMARMDG